MPVTTPKVTEPPETVTTTPIEETSAIGDNLVKLGDEESYNISTDQEDIKQILLYLCYNEHTFSKILDYETVSYDNEFIMNIYGYALIGGDYGMDDEILFRKFTVVVDRASGNVNFQEPIVLRTVYGNYNAYPYIVEATFN